MQLSNPSTALFVRDIHISKSFYVNNLGLSVELDFGKNVILKSGLTLWEIQNKHIIPSKIGLELIMNSVYNRFEIYFETENLEEVYDSLNQYGVEFLHGIHEEPWGQKTIRFFDPDHHLIEVGESMKTFVCRFYRQGLTIEEVSARTSVPVEEVRRLVDKIQ